MIKPRRFGIAAGRPQIGQQFLPGHIQQENPHCVAIKVAHQIVNAAPGCFQRLKRRLMQDGPQLIANCGVHRSHPGRLARIGAHNMRLHDALQQVLNRGGPRISRSRRRRRGRFAQQPSEQIRLILAGRRWVNLDRFRRGQRGQFGDRLGKTGRIEQSGAAAAQRLK